MKKYLVLSIAVVLSGCASPPEAPLLSPYGRQPVNSDAAIAEYREQSQQEAVLRRERNDLKSEVEALRVRVDELKAYIRYRESEQGAAMSPKANPSAVQSKVEPERASLPLTQNAVEVRQDGIVFRVFNHFGMTEFEPSEQLREPLLSAARESTHIDIRGRTDSNYASEANQRVALGRAIAARDYLIAHGVDAKKIRLYFSSSGMFIADNSSAEGRSLNRRVEVETRGIEVANYQQLLSSI